MTRSTILAELREFDTPLLANTIGYIDPTPPQDWYMAGSINSVTPELAPSVGIAVTCEMDTSTPKSDMEMEPYWEQVEQINQMSEPAVWVIKTAGSRPEHECVLGDGMGKTLASCGCAAVVTDGYVRDVAGYRTVALAVYARGTVAHHCPYRFASINQPVEIGGITINPGDVIHANEEGVIRVPDTCLDALPEAAVRMRAFEHAVHLVWRQPDVSIADKRRHAEKMLAKYGFAKG